MARGEKQPCPEGQFRDCCRWNGRCKEYVLKDVPKALTSPMKLVGQRWHIDAGWVGLTLCQRCWWAPGGGHSRLYRCGVEGMPVGNSRAEASMQLAEGTQSRRIYSGSKYSMGYPRPVTRPPQPVPAGTSSNPGTHRIPTPAFLSVHTASASEEAEVQKPEIPFPSHMTFLGSAVSPAPLVLRLSHP